MKKALNKNNLEKLFYITIIIYFFSVSINLTMISEINFLNKLLKIARNLCYVSLVYIIMRNIIGYNVQSVKEFVYKIINYLKQHIFLCCVIFLTCIPVIITRNKMPLILTIVMWACSFYDIKKILKSFLYSNLLIFVITCICSLFNVIPDITITRGTTIRYSFGYIYPLELTTHFLFLTMIYVYLRGNKYDFRDLIFINIINLLLYKITDARSSFILIILFSFISYFVEKKKINIGKVKLRYFYIFLIVCFIVPIVFSIMYNPNNLVMEKINGLLSNRVYLTQNAFNTYGFSLFGKNIEWVAYGRSLDPSSLASTYNYVDCAYAKILLDQGVIIFILIMLGYGNIMYNAFKREDNMLKVIVSIILIISILEPRLFSIELNPFLIMMNLGLVLSNREIINFQNKRRVL